MVTIMELTGKDPFLETSADSVEVPETYCPFTETKLNNLVRTDDLECSEAVERFIVRYKPSHYNVVLPLVAWWTH